MADLQAMVEDVAQHRTEIIQRLVNFTVTDTLLFRNPDAPELFEKEAEVWDPIVAWVKECLKTDLKTSQNLEVPQANNASLPRLQIFLEGLTDKELVAFYQVSKITKSVLLAATFVRKKINAEETFRAAFLEEIWQAEKWGKDEEAEERRKCIRQELVEVEEFIKK